MWSAKRLRDDRRNNSTYAAARVHAGGKQRGKRGRTRYLIIRSCGRTHLYIIRNTRVPIYVFGGSHEIKTERDGKHVHTRIICIYIYIYT